MSMSRRMELPDPFRYPDGRRITSPQEWPALREYWKKYAQEHFYGTIPPRPEHLEAEVRICREIWEGSAVYEQVRITTGRDGLVRFNVHIFYPAGGRDLIPVVIGNSAWLAESVARYAVGEGVCLAAFEIDEAAPDDPEMWNRGGCAAAYPEYTWRSLAMWGWLQSRVIDYLETRDIADTAKTVVTGHSRMGKSALCCGIYDERAAVVAPAGSGCGGMASMRLSGGRLGENIGLSERIGMMCREDRFAYWLLPEAAGFGTPDGLEAGREDEFPLDADILGACVAPRGLVLAEGLDDTWINTYGTQTAWLAASEVFTFLGVTEKCAIHYREGGHRFREDDWAVVLDFAKVLLEGKEKQTGYKTVYRGQVKSGYSWRCPGDCEAPEEPKPDYTRKPWSFL